MEGGCPGAWGQDVERQDLEQGRGRLLRAPWQEHLCKEELLPARAELWWPQE